MKFRIRLNWQEEDDFSATSDLETGLTKRMVMKYVSEYIDGITEDDLFMQITIESENHSEEQFSKVLNKYRI